VESFQGNGITISLPVGAAVTNHFRACVFDAAGNATPSESVSAVGASVYRMFVSSTKIAPTSITADFSGADSLCQSLADASPYIISGNSWKALLASASNGIFRSFTLGNFPVYNIYGEQVAATRTDLLAANTTDLLSPVAYTETAEDISAANDRFVWTGSSNTGTTGSGHCTNWGTSAGLGTYGNPGGVTAGWLNTGTTACSGTLRLYCMEVGSAR
jgi:hypothetical protein